jgi:hypothetical protein
VEERRSWLPAGLESPRLEPDDRASQRREANGGKRTRGPTAAGGPGADDREPTPQRGRSEKTSGGSAKPEASKAQERRWIPVSAPSDGPKDEGQKRAKQSRRTARRQGSPPRGAEERAEPRREPDGPENVDAMGQDKYRKVVGKRYGLSRTRQFLFYGIFLAFVIAAYIGLKAAADSLDKAPAHDTDQAPWSKPGAPQGPLGGFEPRRPNEQGSPTHFQ